MLKKNLAPGESRKQVETWLRTKPFGFERHGTQTQVFIFTADLKENPSSFYDTVVFDLQFDTRGRYLTYDHLSLTRTNLP